MKMKMVCLLWPSSTYLVDLPKRITRATSCIYHSSGPFHFDVLCFSCNKGVYPSHRIIWCYRRIYSFCWEWRNTSTSWANRPCVYGNRPTSIARLDDAGWWMSEEWVLLCSTRSCTQDRWGDKPEKGSVFHWTLTQSLTQFQECVLCRNIYITEKDWAGRENLVPVNASPAAQTVAPVPETPLPTGLVHVAPSTSQSHHQVSLFEICSHWLRSFRSILYLQSPSSPVSVNRRV